MSLIKATWADEGGGGNLRLDQDLGPTDLTDGQSRLGLWTGIKRDGTTVMLSDPCWEESNRQVNKRCCTTYFNFNTNTADLGAHQTFIVRADVQ